MPGVRRSIVFLVPLLLIALVVLSSTMLGADLTRHVSEEPAFDATWARTDFPVEDGAIARTWFWGPSANTELIQEDNDIAAGGIQRVQYFDKARMELPDPGADPESPGYVLAGLLVSELVDGGDSEPATINVAGDLDDPGGITYATVAGLLDEPPLETGTPITHRLSGEGTVSDDPDLAVHDVTAAYYIVETDHTIASVFWEFLTSSGTVWNGNEFTEARLFPDPFFGAGFPITEAYWTSVRVAGETQDVLLQCFQRRCLTYTPGNPEGWQVESNNAGLHYYQWRYGDDPEATPAPTIGATATANPSPTPAMPTQPASTASPTGTAEPQSDLPIGRYVTADGATYEMTLEVAATFATRACGLMHRDTLPADTGMLFIFEQDNSGGFWNCNTFVPLTLAWIDADGTIIGFSDMEPQVRGEPQITQTYPPPGPYRYVVEANRGWFSDRGIEAGDYVDLSAAIEHGDTSSDTLCQQLGLACN